MILKINSTRGHAGSLLVYHYATHTGDGFRTVRHVGIIVRTDRTCVSGSGGNYPDPACLDARVKYRNCSVMLDCDV